MNDYKPLHGISIRSIFNHVFKPFRISVKKVTVNSYSEKIIIDYEEKLND